MQFTPIKETNSKILSNANSIKSTSNKKANENSFYNTKKLDTSSYDTNDTLIVIKPAKKDIFKDCPKVITSKNNYHFDIDNCDLNIVKSTQMINHRSSYKLDQEPMMINKSNNVIKPYKSLKAYVANGTYFKSGFQHKIKYEDADFIFHRHGDAICGGLA